MIDPHVSPKSNKKNQMLQNDIRYVATELLFCFLLVLAPNNCKVILHFPRAPLILIYILA